MTWQTLSSASSVSTHNCRGADRQGCRGCRWFETKLSRRATRDDRLEYRVETVGRSLVPGEVDRFRTEVTTSPHAVVDFLAMGNPHNRYIPKISRKVLHEAADLDSRLGEALDDFDTVTTR